MEKKYELLHEVLIRMQKKGVLNGLVLIGSWCQFYYKIHFDNSPEIPLLRTTDVDFLVPNPSKIRHKIDVTKLLNKLGFDNDFDYSTGLVKYVHPDLEVQFLTPASGRVKDTPYEIKNLNINAEGLSHLKMLQDFTFNMNHNGITVNIPEPSAYILHKILISQKRKAIGKKEKDLMAAQSIGKLCIEDERHRERLKSIYYHMPKKWQKEVSKLLKQISPELFSFFESLK